jgi:hypothetical protein
MSSLLPRPVTPLNAGVNLNGGQLATVGGGDYQADRLLTFLPADHQDRNSAGQRRYNREQDEAFSLNLSGATNASITDSQGVGTITNDDTDVTLSVSPASVSEDGAANLVYTFTRNGNTTGALTANFSVAGGATFGTDYTQSGAATFTATTGTVTSPVIQPVTIHPVGDGPRNLMRRWC